MPDIWVKKSLYVLQPKCWNSGYKIKGLADVCELDIPKVQGFLYRKGKKILLGSCQRGLGRMTVQGF